DALPISAGPAGVLLDDENARGDRVPGDRVQADAGAVDPVEEDADPARPALRAADLDVRGGDAAGRVGVPLVDRAVPLLDESAFERGPVVRRLVHRPHLSIPCVSHALSYAKSIRSLRTSRRSPHARPRRNRPGR